MRIKPRTDYGAQAFDRAELQGDRYVARVNKGRLDVERHTDALNDIWRRGWTLTFVFEQDGNTVMIFERREAVA